MSSALLEQASRSGAAASPASDWMTPTTAAAYLGMPTVKALYQAVRRGTVPAHRLGRRLLFHRPTIDRFLLNRPTLLSTTLPR